jgi:hypothetical protein
LFHFVTLVSNGSKRELASLATVSFHTE